MCACCVVRSARGISRKEVERQLPTMRCFLVMFVYFQFNMVTSGLSEEINFHTTMSPTEANEHFSTESKFIAETTTEVVTEISTTNINIDITTDLTTDLTTEKQLISEETIAFTNPTEITGFSTSASLSTSEQVEERSTFLVPESQTFPPEVRTTIVSEEDATDTVTAGIQKTSQNLENRDTKFTEQLSPTEIGSQKLSTDSKVTNLYGQTTRGLDRTLIEFDPENNPRSPESTTLAVKESDIQSTSGNQIKILCKTAEDCAFGMLCVSMSNSCGCASKRDTNERNLNQCRSESIQSRSNNTHVDEENEDVSFAYRKLLDLSPSEQTGYVATLAFTPSVEIVEWFQNYEGKFKSFFASRLAIAWNKLNNETVRFPKARNNILYVSPSPFQTASSIVVSFLVKNPFSDSSEDYLRAEDVLDCVKAEWNELEAQLHLNVSYMKIGFPFEALQPSSGKVLGNLDENEVKMLVLGMLVLSTCSLLAAIVAITLQCRTRRSTFIDLSAIRRLPYGHPAAVLVRSPGDGTIGGRDLASDQQCKEEELDREHWMASHSQRGDETNDDKVEKTAMVEIQGPKKDERSETPF